MARHSIFGGSMLGDTQCHFRSNEMSSVVKIPHVLSRSFFSQKVTQKSTSRERPKSAPYLRLKIEKGGPSGLCETPAGCKNEKKIEGEPLGT